VTAISKTVPCSASKPRLPSKPLVILTAPRSPDPKLCKAGARLEKSTELESAIQTTRVSCVLHTSVMLCTRHNGNIRRQGNSDAAPAPHHRRATKFARVREGKLHRHRYRYQRNIENLSEEPTQYRYIHRYVRGAAVELNSRALLALHAMNKRKHATSQRGSRDRLSRTALKCQKRAGLEADRDTLATTAT